MKHGKILLLSAMISIVACTSEKSNKIARRFALQSDQTIVVESYNGDELLSSVSYMPDTQTKEGRAAYYDQGVIKKVSFWNEGSLVGGDIDYDNGKPSRFICHDSYGDIIFYRQFNGKTIVADSGNILPHGFLSQKKLKTDSTVKYTAFIVKPPYTSAETESYIINLKSFDTIRPFQVTEDYNWVHTYHFKIDAAGRYKHMRITYLVDSLQQKMMFRATDSTIFDAPL